jgi:hypothetical protein
VGHPGVECPRVKRFYLPLGVFLPLRMLIASPAGSPDLPDSTAIAPSANPGEAGFDHGNRILVRTFHVSLTFLARGSGTIPQRVLCESRLNGSILSENPMGFGGGSGSALTCPKCGSQHLLYRSRGRGIFERIVLRVTGRYPFHCDACGVRFYAKREKQLNY